MEGRAFRLLAYQQGSSADAPHGPNSSLSSFHDPSRVDDGTHHTHSEDTAEKPVSETKSSPTPQCRIGLIDEDILMREALIRCCGESCFGW